MLKRVIMNNELSLFKGIGLGLLISIPLWALIIFTILKIIK